METPYFEFLGWVPELKPLYSRSLVSIAPLRFGAGVKSKVGDALRHGLPVVATSIGAEGMGLVSPRDVIVGDDPASFAAGIVRLCTDETLWNSVRESGFEAVTRTLSADAARAGLGDCLAAVGLPSRSRPGGLRV